MNAVVSFFMSVCFAVMSLLGIPFDAPDLEKTELNPAVATEESIALFREIPRTYRNLFDKLSLQTKRQNQKNENLERKKYAKQKN